MSAVEMAASGVPMVVSALQGLKETVEPGKTGYLFAPGNHIELANRLDELLSDSARRDELSKASRVMAIERFTVERQVAGITEVVKRVIDSPARWSR
jgi:glycosyltransferase involved in cell wall biosynthesis